MVYLKLDITVKRFTFDQVKVHEDKGDSIGVDVVLSREQVVSALEKDYTL